VKLRPLPALFRLAIAVWSLTPDSALAQSPDAPPPLPDAVELRELERDGRPHWLYLPRQRAAEALVVVPPSGGTLLTAPELAPSDRVEHLPYVEAGFAVISFRPSGAITGEQPRKEIEAAVADFARVRAGVVDAQGAIALALEQVPALAGKPIFAAGHSSAANLALALGAEEPRLRAVIAYAPVADVEAFLEGGFLRRIAAGVPGALERARELAPVNLVDRLDVPLLLFHAEDDDVAPIEGTRALARRLEARKHPPRLVIVASGGHYDAMISEGIPAGVSWLRERAAARP
jgi:dipeptidyl aminopeptidase/acylaminoacyl peptidase